MSKGQVIGLCGQIAAGKTAYAELLKQEKGAVLLSCDDLMLTLFDACLGDRHDETLARCYDYLHRLAVQLAEAGNTVVLDFGYWTKQSRNAAREFFAAADIPFSMVWLVCTDDVRFARLEKRNERLQHEVRRVFIIDREKRERLDLKFECPNDEQPMHIVDTTAGLAGFAERQINKA